MTKNEEGLLRIDAFLDKIKASLKDGAELKKFPSLAAGAPARLLQDELTPDELQMRTGTASNCFARVRGPTLKEMNQ